MFQERGLNFCGSSSSLFSRKVLTPSSPNTIRTQSNNSYIQAMKALQDRIKKLENLHTEQDKSNIIIIERNNNQIFELNNRCEGLEKIKTEQQCAIQRLYEELNDQQNYYNVLEKKHLVAIDQTANIQQQISFLQQERSDDQREQKLKSESLYTSFESLRTENKELIQSNQQLQNQMEEYKISFRNQQQRTDLDSISEIHRINNLLLEYQNHTTQSDAKVKLLEKKVSKLIEEKKNLEITYADYQEKNPWNKIVGKKKFYVLQELENKIKFLEAQVQERIVNHQFKMDDLLQNLQQKEDSYQKRFQEFYTESIELKNQNNRLGNLLEEQKQENEQLQRRFQEIVNKQQRFRSGNQDNDRKHYQSENLEFSLNETKRNQEISFADATSDFESKNEKLLLQIAACYKKYDQILKQAQIEKDFKVRARQRSELLTLADEIKNFQSLIKNNF